MSPQLRNISPCFSGHLPNMAGAQLLAVVLLGVRAAHKRVDAVRGPLLHAGRARSVGRVPADQQHRGHAAAHP